ncbi:MAG: hypothetical protein DRJ47_02250 [Thermoprotei archaeon]|nr:MAG: hypothetical protein DRJ47_02250 [Thermoprotei archaeon]
MAEHSLELPFVVGACSAFSASLLALYWTRGRDEIFESRKRRYREFLKKGAYVIIKSKPLVLLTVGSFFIALSIPNFTLTWAPYMEDLGASEWLLGLASSVFMATMGLGSYIGGRLVKRLNYKNTVVLALSSMSLAFLALTFVKIHIFS